MITITKAAADKLTDLFRENDAEGAALRVFIRTDGMGPQVGMAIETNPSERDESVVSEGVRVVVDVESLPFVIGSEIDYIETMEAAGFTLRNPNMSGGCACGGGGCACGGGGHGGHGGGGCACGGH
jgi:iron-sulfur cluster assembly accessory protein